MLIVVTIPMVYAMILPSVSVASRSSLNQTYFIFWIRLGYCIAFGTIFWSPYSSQPATSFVNLHWHRFLISLIRVPVLSIIFPCTFSQRDDLEFTLPIWNLTKIVTARKVTKWLSYTAYFPCIGQPRCEFSNCACI